jgi:hypothetical protein
MAGRIVSGNGKGSHNGITISNGINIVEFVAQYE